MMLNQMRDHYAKLPTWQLEVIRREANLALKLPGLSPEQLADVFLVVQVVGEQLVLRGVEAPRPLRFTLNGEGGVPSASDD